MHPAQRLQNAPRCTAKAKRSGQRCRSPAKTGYTVCRMHGAGGGAPCGAAHPNYRNGLRSKEVRMVRVMVKALGKV
ncbi:hypothetical protein O4H53_21535 [Sulfitobacter sp. G21635-S1]|nr:hypothetical protein [Sulfitobacter sp. G21635-S1]